jgi:hypothetical protein
MAGLKNARRFGQQVEKNLDLASQELEGGYNNAINTYSDVPDNYKPYMDLGKTSASAMEKLFSDPSKVTEDPFYKEREKRQLDAVQNSAAAKGGMFGGAVLEQLMKTGGEFASAEFDKATARYSTGVQAGLAGTQGYDQSKSNLAEMEIGRGMAKARQFEGIASLKGAAAQSSMGMFTSWFGGSGPFGQMTSKCYIAAYHFGHATPEHYLIAMHVRNGTTWRAKLARIIYGLLHPLFKALLKEAS